MTTLDEQTYAPMHRAQLAVSQVAGITSDAALQGIRNYEIRTDADAEFASQLLSEIKGHWLDLNDQRRAITGPLREAENATNRLFRPALSALIDEEKILKAKIADYMDRKQQSNERAIQAAAQAPSAAAAQQQLATVTTVEAPKGVSVRMQRKFEVLQPDLVPRELCSPDVKKIQAALARGLQVPGVRIYEEPVVSARSSK